MLYMFEYTYLARYNYSTNGRFQQSNNSSVCFLPSNWTVNNLLFIFYKIKYTS